jgi:hypothetical protein
MAGVRTDCDALYQRAEHPCFLVQILLLLGLAGWRLAGETTGDHCRILVESSWTDDSGQLSPGSTDDLSAGPESTGHAGDGWVDRRALSAPETGLEVDFRGVASRRCSEVALADIASLAIAFTGSAPAGPLPAQPGHEVAFSCSWRRSGVSAMPVAARLSAI